MNSIHVLKSLWCALLPKTFQSKTDDVLLIVFFFFFKLFHRFYFQLWRILHTKKALVWKRRRIKILRVTACEVNNTPNQIKVHHTQLKFICLNHWVAHSWNGGRARERERESFVPNRSNRSNRTDRKNEMNTEKWFFDRNLYQIKIGMCIVYQIESLCTEWARAREFFSSFVVPYIVWLPGQEEFVLKSNATVLYFSPFCLFFFGFFFMVAVVVVVVVAFLNTMNR